MEANWSGVYTALVTPFQPDGSFDPTAMQALVERQILAGVTGLVPCGTTGESAAMTAEEHQLVVARVVEAAAGRVPVVAGAGSNSFQTALELSKRCLDAGADALLHVTPYYIKPTQRGLVGYYESLAEAIDLPIIMYNVPSRTAVALSTSSILQLAQHPQIVGLKQAVADLDALNAILYERPAGFAILSGEDSLTVPMIAMGADGVISVTSNLAPALMCRLVKAALQGDRAATMNLQAQLLPLMKAMFVESNPIPAKFALSQLQLIHDQLRLPLGCLAEEYHAQVVNGMVLAELDLPTQLHPQQATAPHRTTEVQHA